MSAETIYRIYSDKYENKPLSELLNEEINLFTNVQDGRLDIVQDEIENHGDPCFRMMEMENMTGNLLQDAKYYEAVRIGILCRLCIAKGLDTEQAFKMNSYYLRIIDNASSLDSIMDISEQMLLDYTGKMDRLNRMNCKSKLVSDSMGYIAAHICEPMTLNDVADAVGLSPSYVSRQFQKETGVSISDYIRESKLKKAGIMLRYTDHSYSEISDMFGFSSQSHFIRKFKEYYGTTPKKYREQLGRMRKMPGVDNKPPAYSRFLYDIDTKE